jgi:hypothetical protein
MVLRSSAALRTKRTCFSCSSLVGAIEQQPRDAADRVQRRAKLVSHAGQKARLRFVCAAQRVGFLIELGIERHDTSVGIFQLPVEPQQLLLSLAHLLDRTQQLLVLLLYLLIRRLRRVGYQLVDQPCNRR